MTETKKILIVEDDGIIGERLRITFQNWGYLTINADTGDEAIRLALSEHPDMVLMDLLLKGNMNGIQAAHAIHEHLDIPIVYLTAYSDEHLLNQTKNTNSYGYLIKPVRDRELWATMEMAFHKYRADKLIQEKNRELTKEIAERQRVEDALKKSEQSLSRAYHFAEATLDALTAHVCVLDESGRILKVNKAWREFADVNSPSQTQYFIGSNYLSICDAAAQMNCKEAIAVASGIRAMINGETDQFSMEYPCHSSIEFRWFIINITRFYDDHGLRLVVAHENITERKQAEDALKKQLEFTNTLIETIPNPVFFKDTRGRYLGCNRAFEKFIGVSKDDIIGKSVFDLYPKDIADRYDRKDAELFINTGNQNYEWKVKQNNGQVSNVIFNKATFKDSAKKIAGLIGGITDITELRQMETELRQAKAWAEERSQAAEAATRAKSEFLANMSHEIRTPLNAIIGFSRIVSDKEVGELNEIQSEYLGNVVKSGEHLLSLISNILDFSKIEAGKLELEILDFNLNDVIAEVVNLLRFTAEEKGILLRSHIDSDVPAYLRGDPTRLRQILLNLANNAVKFTEKGEIRITVRNVECVGANNYSPLQFEISDTGIGIPEGRLDSMFQAFSQADMSTTRKFGGTGLGLAISKSLVEKMNGQIGVDSAEGKGSKFWFTAEFEKSVKCDVLSVMKEDNLNTFHLTHNTSLRILLVEDNVFNQRIMFHILKNLGFEADVANNGIEAIRAVQTVPYDIVLMDIQMPKMDGIEATKIIRKWEAEKGVTHNTPIIAMTAHAMESDREACFQAGMNAYISKPINAEELIGAIRNQLADPAPHPSPDPSPKRRGEASDSSPFPFREGGRGVRFDKTELLNRVGGSNEAFCNELIETFVQYFPGISEELKSALNENDPKSARLHAHSLKGMSMQISAHKLADIAADMENYAINGELDNVRSLISGLDEEFELLKAVVDDICPSPP